MPEVQESVSVTPVPRTRKMRAQVLVDLAAFIGTLILAKVFNWQTADLVWSLLLTSLALGSAVFLIWVASTIFRLLPSRITLGNLLQWFFKDAIMLGVVCGGIFALFFGGAHFVYSIFLGQFLPPYPGCQMPSVEGYQAIWNQYWVFLPLAFAREFRVFIAAFSRTSESTDTTQFDFWISIGKNLLRTHILIFVVAFLFASRTDGFLLYCVVSAVYFFPWSILQKPKSDKSEGKDLKSAFKLAREKTKQAMLEEERKKQRKKKKR